MQPKFAVERFNLGRLDELRMSHHHAMQRPIELFLPERQEFDQDRKIRRKVVVLPDIGLQQTRVIRQMIENTRGGKPISRELLDKIWRRLICFDPFGCGHYLNLRAGMSARAGPYEALTSLFDIDLPQLIATSDSFAVSIQYA